MDPLCASDTMPLAPLGVTPINTLTVFLFLYDEKVQARNKREDGLSMKNSVASMIILVFGYKLSGIYF